MDSGPCPLFSSIELSHSGAGLSAQNTGGAVLFSGEVRDDCGTDC